MKNDITIVKIGTKALFDSNNEVRLDLVKKILEITNQKNRLGEKILLVTSGAVAMGRKTLGIKDVNRAVAAAVGQVDLMNVYAKCAKDLNLKVLEILLSRVHIVERRQFLSLQEKINLIFSYNNIIPIVNENDFLVSDCAWSFGDNDSLASALAIAFGAKKLIIISQVGGLYTADPGLDKNATLIKTVENVGAELMEYCSKNTSDVGRGGMISKLKNARLCAVAGVSTQIIGSDLSDIEKAFDNQLVGTTILPSKKIVVLKNRDRWILSAKSSAGSIEVDDGAQKALEKGKSLLAVGVKKIYGVFEKGEIVEVINSKKESLALGVADIDYKQLISCRLSHQKGVRVIHVDNMLII